VAAPDVRRLTAEDLPALTREVERARAAGEFRASSDADGEFFLKSFALDPAIVSGAFDRGELVGFVSGEFKMIVVRPDRRRQGIGRALVGGAIEGERARSRSIVLLGVAPDDDAGKAFLAATAFEFHSTLWDLDLPPDTHVGEPSWPAGTTARPFDRTRDVQPWIDLFNLAFADHATPLQLDASFIVPGLEDPALADADTELVEDTASGELVGFCATAPIRRDGTIVPHAEIWTIGVRPDRQGGGLGRQLLRWGVRYLRSIGAPAVSLSVNARNERALGLYESEGFVRSATRERWARATQIGAELVR
jgi:mycothiol synthase